MNPEPVDTEETKTGPRWGRILAWGGLFGLLVVVGLGLIRTQGGQVQAGKRAPQFELTSFEGEVYSSENLLGKVVVLNFWASFCVPCVEEADELEAAWQHYQERDDVIFLGVAWSDMDSKALAYIDEHDITYPNGPDTRTLISQAFRMVAVPETYIIAKNGNLAHVQIGPFTSVDQITSLVDPLLTSLPPDP